MSQSLDEQSTRLYRIRKTIMEMLRDRDYVVAEFELSFTKDQFREKYGDEPKREDLVIQKPSGPTTQSMWVSWHAFLWLREKSFGLGMQGVNWAWSLNGPVT
jgi:hypothetical protein